MEVKKNPKKDLNKSSGIFFAAGMAMVLALTYVAVEWKTFYDIGHVDIVQSIEPQIDEEVPVVEWKTPPPPPPPIAPPIIEVVPDDDDIKETVIESSEIDENTEVVEVEEVEYAEVEEEVKVNWVTIEQVPIFPGCENAEDKRACFQDKMKTHIRKVFRYPVIAQEMGVEGKVFTQFTIAKDGSIANILLRGPDKNLEKEAKRIIGKLPKMTPGKQRDQNVKVAFSIPILFQLN